MNPAANASKRRGELALRVMSAAVLIPFGLAVVWAGGPVLAIGCALFAALMAYEWVRMSCSPLMRLMVALAIVPPAVAGVFGPAFGALALLGCAIVAGVMHPLASQRVMSGFGLFYVSGMALALFVLREGPWEGQAAALWMMAMVWGSDSAAYFSGKGFGGPPLTKESPSKTWSGAVGALIFSTMSGLLVARMLGGDAGAWMVAGFVLSVFAQSGDLMESMIKRHFGVKDASGLVPGHGGVLDRVDGLGIVCVVAVVSFYLVPGLLAPLGLAG